MKILTHSLLVVVFVKKEDVMQKTVAHVLESMVRIMIRMVDYWIQNSVVRLLNAILCVVV